MIEVDAGFCRECGGMACWDGDQVRCVICSLAREPTESEAERHRSFADHSAHRDLLATTERELVEAVRDWNKFYRQLPFVCSGLSCTCVDCRIHFALAAYDRARVKGD